MGMDSYILKSDKKSFYEYIKNTYISSMFEEKFDNFTHSLTFKYPGLNIFRRDLIEKTLTEDELNTIDALSTEYTKLYKYSYNPTEIAYWRKPYVLHEFIVLNFHDMNLDDNGVPIPLSKKDIKTILDNLKKSIKYCGISLRKEIKYTEYNRDKVCALRYKNINNPFGDDGSGYWDALILKKTYNIFNNILKSYNKNDVYYYYSSY